MRSNLVDITLIKVAETKLACGFKETEDDEELVWLPKSQIEMESTKKKDIFVVTMSEALANDKELI